MISTWFPPAALEKRKVRALTSDRRSNFVSETALSRTTHVRETALDPRENYVIQRWVERFG